MNRTLIAPQIPSSKLLDPPIHKNQIAASITERVTIGVLEVDGPGFADLMVVCRQLVQGHILLSQMNDAKPLEENEAYMELLRGAVQFFKKNGRTVLSLTNFITDVPEILASRGLLATLRN